MDEPRPRQGQQELEVTAALPVTNPPEPVADVPEAMLEAARTSPEILGKVPGALAEEPTDAETVFEKLDHDVAGGLTVGDGFRFGCGFVLALTIGTLAFLVVMTAFAAVGALMGFKLPF